MNSPVIKKICPTSAELLNSNTDFTCPEVNCCMKFSTSPNLDMHLFKKHKIGDPDHWKKKTTNIETHFHCPHDGCIYSVTSSRHFQKMKYLKQHYIKVHAEKVFKCSTCDKGFPTAIILQSHIPICGVKFVCFCNSTYDSSAALSTHFKRSGHSANNKYTTTSGKSSKAVIRRPASQAIAVPVYMAAVALSELSAGPISTSVDKSIQTDPTVLDIRPRSKQALRICEKGAKQGMSTQTQALIGVPKSKRQRISTETQTSVEYLLKEAKKFSDSSATCQKTATRKRRKSMETQTVPSEKRINKVNPRLKKSPVKCDGLGSLASENELPSYLNSYGLGGLWSSQRNTSSTQTSPVKNVDLEMLNGITQTEPNLTQLFEAETSTRSPNFLHPETAKLSSYFEDNASNLSFGNGVLQPNHLTSTACQGFVSFEDPGYSSSQMESILTRNNKYVFGENRSCSIETQTEIDSFLRPTECNEEDSFALSSTIETQTTEDISTFDQLIYTNMCTQTCNEFLFPELDFADIQTQTAWSEYGDDSSFVSTETQTALSGKTNAESWSLSETSHMETQTDEFRELIAEFEKQNKSEELL